MDGDNIIGMIAHEPQQIRTALLAGAPSSGGDLGVIDRETLFYVESELVEDYLEGSLSDEDVHRFATNYLVTDERRELLNEVRLLKRFSSGAVAFDARELEGLSVGEDTKPGIRGVLIVAGVAAGVIFLALLIFYLIVSS